MKKILLFLLLCANYTAFAQPKYDGDVRYINENAGLGIDATCNVSIFVDGITAGPHFRHSLNSITVHSLKINGTTYSAGQIPGYVLDAIKEEARIQVSFNLYDVDFNIKKLDGTSHISWDELLRLPASEHYKQSTTDAGVKLYNSGRLSIRNVKITSLSYTSSELQNFISEVRNPAKTPVKTTPKVVDNSVTEVGLTMPGSSAVAASAETPEEGSAAEETGTPTTPGIPVNTSGNDPLANYTPSPAYSGATTEKEVYVQAAATAVGSLVNEWGASLDRREARINAEYEANIEAESKARAKKFDTEFLPLMERAKKGDENARMILFFASNALWQEYKVPLRDQWMAAALANNNTNALVYMGTLKIGISEKKQQEEGIALLEKAAALGSADAMLALADLYHNKLMGYKVKNSGENEPKALLWYNKAAEAGSPKAMFCLGLIYKYGNTWGDWREGYGKSKARYTIQKDEKVALEWFSKAALLYDYKKTPFAQKWYESTYSDVYSYVNAFDRGVFTELAKIYKEGKVVTKDKQKAIEFYNAATLYKSSIEYESYGDLKRYK